VAVDAFGLPASGLEPFHLAIDRVGDRGGPSIEMPLAGRPNASTATIRRRSRLRLRGAESNKPSLIACKTTIGFGAPTRAGTAKAHGEALGAEELKGAKEKLGISLEPFSVPERS